jgi:DNA-binding protein HU-beta
MAMTREEVIALIAKQTGCSKARATVALDAVVDGLTESIKRTGYAKIHRLCSFSLVDRAPRTARNPRTGAVVPVAARRVVRIKPLQALRDAVEQ